MFPHLPVHTVYRQCSQRFYSRTVFHPLAKLEMQTYNKTLKRFKGVQSKLFLAYEIRGKRKGKFVGVSVSILRFCQYLRCYITAVSIILLYMSSINYQFSEQKLSKDT